ncbi:MAG: sugar phosphate isomerase/epimerase [Armatimonadetes bacterium]|nr:sugar phosphate isomerase/epimerase [Armatimonadota bacterium]
MKFSIREYMAPGKTIREKFENLARMGFAGIEIVGSSTAEKLEDILEAAQATGVVPNIFSAGGAALLDARGEERRKGIEMLKDALSLCGEAGGVGVIYPPLISVKMGGRPRIPDLSPLASTQKLEFDLLVSILKEEIAPHAEKVGARLIIEPLNRYEQWWPCRLQEGVEICEAVGSPNVVVMADFFHMNIEEADIAASIRQAGSWIYNVHLADSQRLLPGYGHIDFTEPLAALKEVGYSYYYGFECGIPGDPFVELPKAMDYIRRAAGEA